MVTLLSRIRTFLFYRYIFTLADLVKGGIIYLLYAIPISKKLPRPLTINFLITSTCNLECTICSYHNSRNSDLDCITVEDFEEFISTQLAYKPFIFFGGGEPFARDDLIDLLRVAKRYKLKCGINTNAFLINSEKIKQLIDLKIELLVFSLFGPEEIHDAITGTKGSYTRVIENMTLFCRNKKMTRVILSCVINKENINFLEAVPLIAKDVGVDAVKFEHLNFLSNSEFRKSSSYFAGDKNRVTTYITDFDNSTESFGKKVMERLRKIKKDYGDLVFVKPALSNKEMQNWYSAEFNSKRRCFFVWHSVFIKPNGMVVPCQFLLNYEMGNIKEQKLQDVFRSEKVFHLRRLLKKRLLPECSHCCKL